MNICFRSFETNARVVDDHIVANDGFHCNVAASLHEEDLGRQTTDGQRSLVLRELLYHYDFALSYSLTRKLAVASQHDDQGVGLDRSGFCSHLHRRGRLGGAANQPERASANWLFGNRYGRCSIYSSDAMTDNLLPLGLTFIQPFMAALRPAPNAAKRFIFNWAHSIVGYSAHALASNASTQIICLNQLIHLSLSHVHLLGR